MRPGVGREERGSKSEWGLCGLLRLKARTKMPLRNSGAVGNARGVVHVPAVAWNVAVFRLPRLPKSTPLCMCGPKSWQLRRREKVRRYYETEY